MQTWKFLNGYICGFHVARPMSFDFFLELPFHDRFYTAIETD